MNCPTTDKLSQYVDHLLSEQEHTELYKHVNSCARCTRVVEAFTDEQQFVKETLQTPILPDDFASSVLDQLEPYGGKAKRKNLWKRVMLTAAGMALAVGLSATLSPSFAGWIGGLFTTEQVDEGLRMAADADLAERVNLEVTDNGITFKVEDVIVDSSRVALSYQTLDKNGKPIYVEWDDNEGDITVIDQHGTIFDWESIGWWEESAYGLIEFSLREQEATEKLTIKLDIAEMNGVKGNWQLEIPIDLTKSNELTTIVPLNDTKTNVHGVVVNMKEARLSSSSTELFYETRFTEDEQEETGEKVRLLEEKYGKEIVHHFTRYESALQYHIENEQKEAVYQYGFLEGEGYPNNLGLIQGTGQPLEQTGQVVWNESFIPQEGDDKLTFVLDGVFKTVPSDFSVTINPKDLKKNPVSFEYEGNFMTITEAKKQQDYYLRKSIIPIGKRTHFTVKMTGEKKVLASKLGAWVLVDDKGNSHLTYMSGSTNDYTLTIYGMDKVPEELTLHLLSVTRYEELKDKWEVPLFELE